MDASETTADEARGTLTKRSKRYDEKSFFYWWDIAPNLAARLSAYDSVQFMKKDTGEYCAVSPGELIPFLSDDRRTSRGDGHWGIKVLNDHPDELAFEPPRRDKQWLFLSVVWLSDKED